MAPVKRLADLRNRANSQQYSSIYEDQRPKIVEDIEKSGGETIKWGALKDLSETQTGVILLTETERQISLCYFRELARWERWTTVHLLEEETHQQRNHQQITTEEGEGGSGSHTNLNPALIWKYN